MPLLLAVAPRKDDVQVPLVAPLVQIVVDVVIVIVAVLVVFVVAELPKKVTIIQINAQIVIQLAVTAMAHTVCRTILLLNII
ncbi:MAG: hypothetical protein ACI976_001443 [Aureispira sp.]|jgi:hypothetical protein